jgi:hypothetical protein
MLLHHYFLNDVLHLPVVAKHSCLTSGLSNVTACFPVASLNPLCQLLSVPQEGCAYEGAFIK